MDNLSQSNKLRAVYVVRFHGEDLMMRTHLYKISFVNTRNKNNLPVVQLQLAMPSLYQRACELVKPIQVAWNVVHPRTNTCVNASNIRALRSCLNARTLRRPLRHTPTEGAHCYDLNAKWPSLFRIIRVAGLARWFRRRCCRLSRTDALNDWHLVVSRL